MGDLGIFNKDKMNEICRIEELKNKNIQYKERILI